MRSTLLLSIFYLIIGLAVGTRPPPPITEQILRNVAGSLQMYIEPLPQMPKLYGYSIVNGWPKSVTLIIGMFEKKWKFHRDLPPTTVFAFGTCPDTATFPGPTIEALQGVPLHVTWQNHLPHSHILPWDPTIPVANPKHGGVPAVVHLHGGVHEPQSDGSALAWFTAGYLDTGPKWTQPTYTYPNVQHPGNLWYHDHTNGLTRANLLAGLIGAYVIRNPHVEVPFGLPSGDAFDRHLILADRSFATDGSLYMNNTGDNPSIHPQWQPEYFGEAITVNGKVWPFLAVQRRKYRFRIINASNARYFKLALSNGLMFYVVGSDSSYLPKPVASPTIVVSPSETFDVVIDFSKSTTSTAELTNSASYPYPNGTAAGQLNGKVMRFVISADTPTDDSRIPSSLVNYPAANEGEATVRRYITMYEYQSSTGKPTHFYINGKSFEDPVTEMPRPGSTEVWEVINLTGDNHPLHVHLATSQAVRVTELVDLTTFGNCMTANNDAVKCNVSGHAVGKKLPVPEYEKTWKNVVKIEPGYVTTVVVKFRLIDTNASYPFDATAEPGYVYHCHILDHEDNEMSRPMALVL
ncbi:multicopper oxidase LPR1 homolog 1 [Elaeis guineensis]|uniref:Multicopper oxidase LPR1 homolog 1 n=1 Tax=Elaeis guineensis var. tenera TaxID=51953 RepID=A0A6I9QWG3_ELAGV|nr:multicopper oxidase LPR1 homolog 1 [Elaeis guineensis]XP_019704518.1 multicopper oxidase LPR1 homolog 1 [Elaeis guineensis]XP_019704519.1 multicopper oxidase LPR1 homolog 1 [Elaeis guineensis]